MKRILFLLVLFATLSCSGEKSFKVDFDGSKEMSGAKFALRDINPDLSRGHGAVPDLWNK